MNDWLTQRYFKHFFHKETSQTGQTVSNYKDFRQDPFLPAIALQTGNGHSVLRLILYHAPHSSADHRLYERVT